MRTNSLRSNALRANSLRANALRANVLRANAFKNIHECSVLYNRNFELEHAHLQGYG